MHNSRRKVKGAGESQGRAALRRMYVRLALLVLVVSGLMAGGFFVLYGKPPRAQPSPPPAAKGPAAAAPAQEGFTRLQGRWVRPDGGYVIDIKAVEASGKMAAGYFNPRAINVSLAEAALDGTTLKVFIELRDINYPGATYHLTYDPTSDQLRGVYFQPALHQRFNVFFVRMK